ncbi:MAG: hypothetical protein ACREMI_13120 [Gemmatimonadales bacterium]
MRPAMMLLLRALVVLGAVLAVISCGWATPLEPQKEDGLAGGSNAELCHTMALSKSWASVPAAGGTIASSGAGLCL